MKLNKNLVVREVAGDWLLIPSGELTKKWNGIFTLNPVAATIIRVLKDGGDREMAVQKILDDFDTDEKSAGEDVDEFIKTLTESGLLE